MNKLLQKFDKKITYPTGKVNGMMRVIIDDDDLFTSSSSEDEPDTPYEQQFVQEELKRYAEPSQQSQGFADDVSSIAGAFSEIDSFVADNKSLPSEIYSTYNFNLKTDIKRDLPIDSYKSQILARIEQNQVIVIEGPTGCGKTTQVPQIIMDSCREKNQYCNIVVTQPRKIATINVAKRVCEERGWTLGTVVGYQVGLEKKVGQDVVITFVTIGVLLQKLIGLKSLREYTHIIIDEVHERNQELDFLLLIVRKFLFTNSPQTKVILMSATIKADEFAYYFRKQTLGQTIPAPILTVSKVSPFQKTVFYLDHVLAHGIMQASMPKFDISKPEISETVWTCFMFLLNILNKLELKIENEADRNGAVLVFLPGIYEIEEALLKMREIDPDGEKWDIIPLHSSLPNDEQAKAFRAPKQGTRKVILSTNIAESSVTVPKSAYVIDFCQTKVMTVDPVTKYMSLKLEWASYTNCEQRAGRVGRTQDGRIYRMVSRQFYDDEMERFSTPEMLRAPLERIVLQAKMLDLNETPSQILALAMKPPNLKNIESTLWQLKECGALLRTCRGIESHADGDITFLGEVMSALPIDVRLSKFILLGQLFSCLEETIIIAAGCSIPNIFAVPFRKRLDAYKTILLWAHESSSDLIALLNLYNVWQGLKREGKFNSKNNSEAIWCKQNLVNLRGLREWSLLITEMKARLEKKKVVETCGPGKIFLDAAEKPLVLKVIMAGAFYPNFFIKSGDSKLVNERDAVKTVGGRDPFSTVYFTGMDHKQPCQIYVRSIKEMIRENGEHQTDVQVGFDGSSKIYVEFKSNGRDPVPVHVDGVTQLTNVRGRIPRQVYEMIRKRQLQYEFRLNVLPYHKAWEFAQKNGIKRKDQASSSLPSEEKNCYSTVDYSPIPGLATQYITLFVSNHVDAGHFWAQQSNEETSDYLEKISEALNKQVLTQVEKDDQLKMGKIYAARFREDGLFYRCQIQVMGGRHNTILFIDFGNLQEVTAEDLYYVPQRPQCHMPALAFECIMHGIRPAYKRNPLGIWDDSVNEQFRRMTDALVMYGEVYSVVNDIVEVILYRTQNKQLSLNEYLISANMADPCTPSFLSKQNHEQRISVQAAENPDQEAERFSYDKIISYADCVNPTISGNEGVDYVSLPLRGPYSPLEIKLYTCTGVSGSSKPVDVEGTSVNAVLLDTEPESPHSRLLVAGYVGQSGEGGKLKLRQTTMMPNVPGIPMLMAAIFCPTMEPKLSADNTLVATVLCGMGYNEFTNRAHYPAHDLLINLDTELKIEELEQINKLRYLMNSGVKLMYEMQRNMSTQDELLKAQIKIKSLLFDLVYMEREPIDRANLTPQNTKWGKHGGLGLLKPSMENEEQDVWQLLWFVKLAGTGNPRQRQIARNLEDIENMCYDVIKFETITCVLCDEEFFNLFNLRWHVASSEHKNNYLEYQKSLEDDGYVYEEAEDEIDDDDD